MGCSQGLAWSSSSLHCSISQRSKEAQKLRPSGWHQCGCPLFESMNCVQLPGSDSRDQSSSFMFHHQVPLPSVESNACHCVSSSRVLLSLLTTTSVVVPQAIVVKGRSEWLHFWVARTSSPPGGGYPVSTRRLRFQEPTVFKEPVVYQASLLIKTDVSLPL